MKKFLNFILLSLACASTYAQALIPFLGENDKYGYSTADGKIVIAPEFDELDPMPEGKAFAHAEKKSKDYLVLRIGMSFQTPPTDEDQKMQICLNQTQAVRSFTDTIADIGVFSYYTGERYFIHFKKWRVKHSYRTEEWENSRCLFTWYPPNDLERVDFRFGACVVNNGKSRFNVIDSNLLDLLPRDYHSVLIADEKYLILGESKDSLFISDRKGRKFSPYFSRIKPAGKVGYFIASALHDPERFYLIRQNGKKILAKAFSSLDAFQSKDALVARNEKGSGLINHQGKILYPFGVSGNIYVVRNGNMAMTNLYNGLKMSLLDEQGRKIFDRDFDRIDVDYLPDGDFILQLRHGDSLSIADRNAKIIFADVLGGVDVLGAHPRQFVTGKNILPKAERPIIKKGLRDWDGKRILDEIYEAVLPAFPDDRIDYCIEDMHFADYDGIRVRQNGLWGLLDRAGKEILPCQFEEISTYDIRSIAHLKCRYSGKSPWMYYEVQKLSSGTLQIKAQESLGEDAVSYLYSVDTL